MSKIEVNSDVFLTGVKIYVEGNFLYLDLTGEANTNIGPTNFSFKKLAVDFNAPEQTNASAFYFRDGHGRVGYNFEFGSVLYLNREDTSNSEETKNDEQMDISVGEDA